MDIRNKDIVVEYFRSRGPGGQRKNKKETSVRITHIPTGIKVTATEFRSQARNRALALDRLSEKLNLLRRKKKPRLPTSVPAGAKEKILREKRLRSERKKFRQKVREW